MAGPVRVRVVGLERTKTNLLRMPAKVVTATRAALLDEAEALLNDSKENYVPVDLGILRSSGHVASPVVLGSLVYVDLGYGGAAAPYALAVHENPRAGHTKGVSPSGRPYKHWAATGQWKYLEKPFNVHVVGMRERIQFGIDAHLARLTL